MSAPRVRPAFNTTLRAEVAEMSQVGEVRRTALDLSTFVGLDATESGTVAIIVSEIAKNLVKHAGGGEVLLTPVRCRDESWLDILGLDKGPGIASITQSLRDGYSTAGSPGTGLGAVRRLSTVFDIFSAPGTGTAIFSRFSGRQVPGKRAPPAMDIGAVNVPVSGEEVSGDGWAVTESNGRTVLLVADGLGHGPVAAEAARAAERLFRERPALGPMDLLEQLHDGLRHTRGAAVAVTEVTHGRSLAKYSGIGNITGLLYTAEYSRNMASMNGTAGGEVRKMQEFSYPFAPAENGRRPVVIMHTDGIATLPKLDRYPGLEHRHPALIAGLIFRDFKRSRDDAAVLVASAREQGIP